MPVSVFLCNAMQVREGPEAKLSAHAPTQPIRVQKVIFT